MLKKQIKLLALGSYTNKQLDAGKAKQISKLLKLTDLRAYIKELKKIESKKSVRLIIPNKKMIGASALNSVKSSFRNKKVIVEEDPSLILGMKIVDNDLVYEVNLKNALENFKKHIVEDYDK